MAKTISSYKYHLLSVFYKSQMAFPVNMRKYLSSDVRVQRNVKCGLKLNEETRREKEKSDSKPTCSSKTTASNRFPAYKKNLVCPFVPLGRNSYSFSSAKSTSSDDYTQLNDLKVVQKKPTKSTQESDVLQWDESDKSWTDELLVLDDHTRERISVDLRKPKNLGYFTKQVDPKRGWLNDKRDDFLAPKFTELDNSVRNNGPNLFFENWNSSQALMAPVQKQLKFPKAEKSAVKKDTSPAEESSPAETDKEAFLEKRKIRTNMLNVIDMALSAPRKPTYFFHNAVTRPREEVPILLSAPIERPNYGAKSAAEIVCTTKASPTVKEIPMKKERKKKIFEQKSTKVFIKKPKYVHKTLHTLDTSTWKKDAHPKTMVALKMKNAKCNLQKIQTKANYSRAEKMERENESKLKGFIPAKSQPEVEKPSRIPFNRSQLSFNYGEYLRRCQSKNDQRNDLTTMPLRADETMFKKKLWTIKETPQPTISAQNLSNMANLSDKNYADNRNINISATCQNHKSYSSFPLNWRLRNQEEIPSKLKCPVKHAATQHPTSVSNITKASNRSDFNHWPQRKNIVPML